MTPDIRFCTDLQSKEPKFGNSSNGAGSQSSNGAASSKESSNSVSSHVPSISIVSSSISCNPILPQSLNTPAPPLMSSGPISATPLNVVNLQKQLKYDDSPSVLFAAAANSSVNPIYDTSNIKSKADKNHTITNVSLKLYFIFWKIKATKI